MKYVSGFIWKLGINFAVCIMWIDETWWNNRLLLVPNCYEVVAMIATMVAMVAPLWCHTLRKKKLLTFNLCVSVTWPLTCAFHIPCTHTPEIIDMHRGVCDKSLAPLVDTLGCFTCMTHCNDIMDSIASQITSLTIVYSVVYSGADQRKHQSSASLAFVRGIHRSPVNCPHNWPVTRKMFPFDDVIMICSA